MKRPAVFLDRDGVLNVEKGYIISREELEIFPYAKKAVELIHEYGYFAIVISNQSAVARGFLAVSELEKINEKIKDELNVDAIYTCPHYPDGIVAKYRKKCNCRKPGAGLIEKACSYFDIDMANSYMVGDRASDILTGKNAGLYTVLLNSGYGMTKLEEDVSADYIYADLLEFAGALTNKS